MNGEAPPLAFPLGRGMVLGYAATTLAFSAALLLLGLRREPGEVALWLGAYLVVGLLSARVPEKAPLVAGFLAFLLGFVRTWRHGVNLDLGLGLVALAIGLWALGRGRRERRGLATDTDLGGLALLSIAALSLLSMAFAIHRIRSFAPAPGFAYHVYRFNPQGLSSEDAVVRVILGAAGAFVWFGLYSYARSVPLERRWLNAAVFLALLVNGAALVVQRHFDPGFLHPAGMPPSDRLNGVTSFCYALGDAALALFLLLPEWGSASRAPAGALGLASLVLLTHAVVASGSRAALLTMIVASVLWAAVRLARVPRARRRPALLLALGGATLLAAAAWGVYRSAVPNQATPLGRLKEGVERQGWFGHLYATRLTGYPLVGRILQAYPLSGVGVGLFPAEVERQRALLAPEIEILDEYLLTSNAPNQFLNTGAELGLPALAMLAVVFLHAGRVAWARWRGGGSGDPLVSLVALAAALQLGPGLQNSEAAVFLWLVVGRAAATGGLAGAAPGVPTRAAAVVVAAVVALGLAGQVLSRPSLAVEAQWQRLRWGLNIGLHPPEAGGRWTGPEATFVVDTEAPAIVVRWHAGDRAVPGYRAEVAFFVDGTEVERSSALSGHVRESVLPLPPVRGRKRISVRVRPPFVPAGALGGDDRRGLGIFVHALSPSGGGAANAR